ncbi:MAG: EamA family transporter [Gammaproteobacteria bacterium]|nr:EamA family transporter [Gammaproteobacteria bacterium]
MNKAASLKTELPLLGLLALLWGSSYLFIKIAVMEIPPLTLIAIRVFGAMLFLILVMMWRHERLPRGVQTWRMLLIQAFFNSIAAWTVLAWGQSYVDAGLASVLNSTSPVFVFIFTAVVTRHERLGASKLFGAILGLSGVVLIVGSDVVKGLGVQVAGQIACLSGAALYACAAIYGRRFSNLSPVVSSAGTMIWASAVLVPLALLVEQPFSLTPSNKAIFSALALSIFCTGFALMIYFRLLRTIGSMGVASQAYLRAAIGVMLGIVLLGEKLTLPVSAGVFIAISGVILINWPVVSQKSQAV